MHSGNSVSALSIVDKVHRDFFPDEIISPDEFIVWLAEFMSHTNCGVVMKNKIEFVKICDGRGKLPVDLHRIKQCGFNDDTSLSREDLLNGKGKLAPMRWSTDTFHERYHLDTRDYTSNSASTYTIGQGHIYTSFDHGWVGISYSAIPIDDCGFPIIPAEQQWVEAASHQIAWKIARRLKIKGKISNDAYAIIERDRDWYFAQAVNHSKQWNSVDEAESYKNMAIRTIPKIQDHSSFFANMQLPEQRYFRPHSYSGAMMNNISSPNGLSQLEAFNPSSQNNYLPVLVISDISNITSTTADIYGRMDEYGSTAITHHGFVYSTSQSPTIDDNKIDFGDISTASNIHSVLSQLTPGTTYYIRYFATTQRGTTYSAEKQFTTL